MNRNHPTGFSSGFSDIKGAYRRNTFSSAVRKAVDNDIPPLKEFFRAVYSETEKVADKYVKCALETGRTYILDAGSLSPHVVSAVTLVPLDKKRVCFSFGGTLPSLRCRGLFRDLVIEATIQEKRFFGTEGFIAPLRDERMSSLFSSLGLTRKNVALECILQKTYEKKLKFRNVSAGSVTIHQIRENHHGTDGMSDNAFFNSYSYFKSRGGQIAMTGDGYIAYLPSYENKGTYTLIDSAVSVDTLLSLPLSFERCILPLSAKEKLAEAGIPFKEITLSLSDFQGEYKFFNPIFIY